jgi:hypothetical protein
MQQWEYRAVLFASVTEPVEEGVRDMLDGE